MVVVAADVGVVVYLLLFWHSSSPVVVITVVGVDVFDLMRHDFVSKA